MSHVRGRPLSDKERVLNVFSRRLNTTDENVSSTNRISTDCNCSNHNKKDGQHKMKRLKSRKERSQMRGGGKETSKSKSHHHHCRQQSSVDMAPFLSCCHASCTSRRDAPFPNVFPAAQEPSMITDSRLIGHHGLFNHEVKSIDIERLLSEQRKLEKSGQKVQEKNNSTLHPSSTTQADPVMKVRDDCQKKTTKKISQEVIVTPGERRRRELDSSPESLKSVLSSKHSSLDLMIRQGKKTDLVVSDLVVSAESQLTPAVDREGVKTVNRKVKGQHTSALEHTPKNTESPGNQTRAHRLSPSPVQLGGSHPTDGFDAQHGTQDPGDCVPECVSAVAAGLFDCLRFPLGRRRDLVSESRAFLLNALQEKHGPRLQENLLSVQRGLGSGNAPVRGVHDQEPIMIDEADPLSTDAFTTASQVNTVSQRCFDSQMGTPFKIKGSEHFDWNSSPPQQQNQTQFCMDFSSEVIAGDRSFAPSPASCWGGEISSAPPHWEDTFPGPLSKDAALFDSFEDRLMNHTRARSNDFPYSDGNIQHFFSYPGQPPERHSAQPMHFPHQQDPFESENYSFVPSFSAQIPSLQQSNHFGPFSHFSHPSTCPPVRSHHADMIHYPPSHMLDREPVSSRPSFPSPENWSFPPMRMY